MPIAKDCSTPEEAFTRQLLQSLDRIKPYSRRLARNPQAADDLLQDTALKALEKHYQWERGSNLTAWLRTIMRHRYFEGCRKKQPLYMGDELEHSSKLSHDAEQPAFVELRETGEAIEQLDPQFRKVLEMVVLDGASYEDTAATLKVPVGTVRSRLSRARTALRAHLDSERRYPTHRLLEHHDSDTRSTETPSSSN